MAKVGRNDPCPCGSGKKYKKCCLKKDHAKQQQRITVQRGDRELTEQLLQFSTADEFYSDALSAAQLYWDTIYAPKLLQHLQRYDMLHFLEWYVFDYRTSQDRKRIVEIFLERNEGRLRPEEIGQLHALADSRLGLYQVQEVKARELRLWDLLRDASPLINGEQWVRSAKPDDVIIGRLLGTPEYTYLSYRAFLLPPDAADGLRTYAEEQFEKYHEEHFEAPLDSFLLDAGYRFFHYIMGEEAEAWQDKMGSDTPYYDARRTRQSLDILEEQIREDEQKALEEQLREEREEGEEEPVPRSEILTPDQMRELIRSQKEPERELLTTSSGLVLPKSMHSEEVREEEQEGEEERPLLYIPGRGF